MKPTSQNNSINAINDAKTLLNGVEIIFLKKKQRKLEINSIERKLSIIF